MMNFSQVNFGGFGLRIYGVFLTIAFFVAVLHFYKKINKEGLNTDFFIHHFWRWILSGILLARIFALLITPEVWMRYGFYSFFAFWEGGLYPMGVIIGFLLMMFFDFKINKISILKWLDIGIFSFLIGQMIMDGAGFFTGEIYGTETNLFWGIKYETFGVDIINPVHPVTIYALLLHLWLFFFLRKKRNRWNNFLGKSAIWGAFMFIVIDFFLQFFRADPSINIGVLRIEQIFDIILIVLLWWGIKTLNFRK